jgi:hypothetical protein
VVVDNSRCRKVVHSDVVLGVVTGSSEGAGAALCGGSMAAKMVAQWRRRAEEEEKRLHGRGWAPYIAGRGGGRRAARW